MDHRSLKKKFWTRIRTLYPHLLPLNAATQPRNSMKTAPAFQEIPPMEEHDLSECQSQDSESLPILPGKSEGSFDSRLMRNWKAFEARYLATRLQLSDEIIELDMRFRDTLIKQQIAWLEQQAPATKKKSYNRTSFLVIILFVLVVGYFHLGYLYLHRELYSMEQGNSLTNTAYDEIMKRMVSHNAPPT